MKSSFVEIAKGRESVLVETSAERFDRMAFAARALRFVQRLSNERTTVAICPGRAALHVEAGRLWGRKGERWAMLVVPPEASRRAIALAVAEIAGDRLDAAYAFDLLMSDAIDSAA